MEFSFKKKPICVKINADKYWLPEEFLQKADIFKVLFDTKSGRSSSSKFNLPYDTIVSTIFRFATSEKGSVIASITNTTDIIKIIQLLDIMGFDKQLIKDCCVHYTGRYTNIFKNDAHGSKISNSVELEEFFLGCFQSKITDEKGIDHIITDDQFKYLMIAFFTSIDDLKNKPRKNIFMFVWNLLDKNNIDKILFKKKLTIFMSELIYHDMDPFQICHFCPQYITYCGISRPNKFNIKDVPNQIVSMYDKYVNKKIPLPSVIITSESYNPKDMNVTLKLGTKEFPISHDCIRWHKGGCIMIVDNCLAAHMIDILLGLDDI